MMKKIIFLIFITSYYLIAQVTKNSYIEQFELYDQFHKRHFVKNSTKKIIFVFTKDSGHVAKEFLDKRGSDYLSSRDILFVADVSSIPLFLRWIILNSFDQYKYPILLIEDSKTAHRYIYREYIKDIMVVSLDNMKVTDVDFFKDMKKVQQFIEK